MCFVNKLELYLSLKMYIIVSLSVLCAEQQLNCLSGELFNTSGYFYSEGLPIVFQRAWKVFRNFALRIINKQSH